ncbi:MAG: helix-turn-helix domain-containing protein [Hyphomonadaceae bacterium]|nr:helix-turn-helix domain-containing protein [Hyphomonadaceae bacterium]
MSLHSLQAADGGFPAMLREWRRARGMSQLELALSIDISARHLSFLETGRAQPSREMTHRLAEALMLPRGARNAMLAKAGFAAAFPATPLDAESLAPFRAMLDEMMRRHAPYPALVCDRYWTILDANDSARALLASLHDGEGAMNVIRMLTQDAAAAAIDNLPEVLLEMEGRIRLEALEAGPDPIHAAQLRDLARAAQGLRPARAAQRSPLVPLVVRSPAGLLRFLTAVAHFGTSEDVTVRDLRLELLFPADDATRAALHAAAP